MHVLVYLKVRLFEMFVLLPLPLTAHSTFSIAHNINFDNKMFFSHKSQTPFPCQHISHSKGWVMHLCRHGAHAVAYSTVVQGPRCLPKKFLQIPGNIDLTKGKQFQTDS